MSGQIENPAETRAWERMKVPVDEGRWVAEVRPGRVFGWWVSGIRRERAFGGYLGDARWAPTRDGALRRARKFAASIERTEAARDDYRAVVL